MTERIAPLTSDSGTGPTRGRVADGPRCGMRAMISVAAAWPTMQMMLVQRAIMPSRPVRTT